MPIVAGGSKTADNVADKALQIHVEVGAFLKAANAKYKVEPDKHRCKKLFQEGDLVMVNLWHSRFLGIRAKLEKHNYGPF